MPSDNPLLLRWRSGGSILAAWLTIPDVVVAESLAASGADAVVVDQQHGGATVADLVPLFMAIEVGGSAAVTRVPGNDRAAIGRALDAGALGIIVPMVDTPEEAAAAVSACRHGQAGSRSHGPLRPHVPAIRSEADDAIRPALILQVETVTALANLEAIAATPGVDALLVGPADLALSLGMPSDASDRTSDEVSRHDAALDRVREACDRHGIAAGMYCTDGATGASLLARGFRFVAAATDIVLVRGGARRELTVARDAIEAGEPSR